MAKIVIPIPEDQKLISKVELKEIKQQKLLGKYWSMKDLEKQINRKQEWIKEHILFPSKFRRILDIEEGDYVFYPQKKTNMVFFCSKYGKIS